jgi:peptide/nickel transport system permease protein
VVIALPTLPVLLVMATIMHAMRLRPAQAFLGIIAIISLMAWAGLARILRGMFLSLREREFVLAAKAIGDSDLRVILRHITPNLVTYMLVSATLTIPGMILTESALAFLGLGVREPASSWGMMIRDATSIVNIERHPWILIPGLFIFIAVLAFNFLGDALRDAADPYKVV